MTSFSEQELITIRALIATATLSDHEKRAWLKLLRFIETYRESHERTKQLFDRSEKLFRESQTLWRQGLLLWATVPLVMVLNIWVMS